MSSTPSPKDLEQLLQLATRGDLVMFSLEYAKGNKDFQEALGAYLAKKYLHNTETASDYAGQMADAFCETKDIGDRWNSYEVTDWEAIFNEANKIIEEGKKLLDLGNADAAATIAMEFIRQLCDNFDENEIDPYEDENIDGHYECEQAENLLLNAISHPAISKDLKKHIVEKVKGLSNRDLADYDLIDLNDLKLEVTRRAHSDKKGLRLLDEQIQSPKDDYNLHVYVERKIALLRQMGKDADADTSFLDATSLGKSNLADIYVEEKEMEKLYEFIKANSKYNTDALDHYAHYTDSSHHEELLSMYVELLKKDASGKADVDKYPPIAASMECMQKLKGGKAAAHQLAVFFREVYRRRPSMMAAIKKF